MAKWPRGRFLGRIWTLWRAVWRSTPWRQKYPAQGPKTIVVLHALLLGDTLMLGALFKSLRTQWPDARILTTCSPATVQLFAGHPWGVEAIAFDPRRPETFSALFAACRSGVDLALLPGENRYALLARACGARWIRGFAKDRPEWKNAICDELILWPNEEKALSEIFASLALSAGIEPYRIGEWPKPEATPVALEPPSPYVVLHIGASNPLRYWPAERWLALADALAKRGFQPVWSCGPGEQELVARADPEAHYFHDFAGRLGLGALWNLLAEARLVVCLDSGVAHLAKLVGCPTVCIFGQGSPGLFGSGEFHQDQPFVSVSESNIPCRDQKRLFGRELNWVRRCARRPGECSDPICIKAVSLDSVVKECDSLLAATA